MHWCCLQINDRYEFYDELDLDVDNGRYLSPNADRGVRNKYLLHSVLVHSGGVHGGHYYAFIRPQKDPKDEWMKYDDEKVTREDAKRALDEQFGKRSRWVGVLLLWSVGPCVLNATWLNCTCML
jgi:ubiquitin carboxyl-terminal hydrolase 7